jgi:hypothetical protein
MTRPDEVEQLEDVVARTAPVGRYRFLAIAA